MKYILLFLFLVLIIFLYFFNLQGKDFSDVKFIFKDLLIQKIKKINYQFLIELEKKEISPIDWQGKYMKNTKEKKEVFDFYSNLDLFFADDSSCFRYISPDYSFNNLFYIPDDLVSLKWEYIIDLKQNSLIRKEVLHHLNDLAKEFYNNFWQKLVIVSAYRSYEYQKWIKDRWCSDYYCAKAWFSEHQTWLAVDFFEATTQKEFLSKYQKYFDFLKNNAHKYWFHNTYQKWREVDWYEIEPWHFRYVWIEFATFLYNKKMTFWEYIKTLIK